jgi:hypothetical protein
MCCICVCVYIYIYIHIYVYIHTHTHKRVNILHLLYMRCIHSSLFLVLFCSATFRLVSAKWWKLDCRFCAYKHNGACQSVRNVWNLSVWSARMHLPYTLYIYTYIHTHTHTHTHTHIYIYIYIYIGTDKVPARFEKWWNLLLGYVCLLSAANHCSQNDGTTGIYPPDVFRIYLCMYACMYVCTQKFFSKPWYHWGLSTWFVFVFMYVYMYVYTHRDIFRKTMVLWLSSSCQYTYVHIWMHTGMHALSYMYMPCE